MYTNLFLDKIRLGCIKSHLLIFGRDRSAHAHQYMQYPQNVLVNCLYKLRNSLVQFTVNKELYIDILRRLGDAVRRKRHEKWRNNTCFLRHDNAPKHRSVLVKHFLAQYNVTILEQLPYSPDLEPVDFSLFPELKSALSVQRFVTLLPSLRMR